MQAVQARRRQGGFTLTELLVATAIFVILMTALVSLFSAAVSSTRQGYASIDAFETGRVAMTTLSRDLGTAFTAREHGDLYNFYGRPDGFMFVGAGDGGQIGRVTYVFHPEASSSPVVTTYRERWGVVEANIRRQVERLAREGGRTGTDVTAAADNVIDLVDDYYYDSTTGVRYQPNVLVEFDVRLDTESLIRYEEAGAGDLDTYDMTVTRRGAISPVALPWPYVDPIDPTNDATPPAGDGDLQQDFLLSAINSGASDLRDMFFLINTGGGWAHPVTGDQLYLRVLGTETFDTLLRTKKREFWLRMLAGESMGLAELSADTNPSQQSGSWGYWYDEGFNAINGNARERKTLNEYVVANGIVSSATLLEPGTTTPIYAIQGDPLIPNTPVDILNAAPKFSYGDGQNEPLRYFNDIENLRDPDNPDGIAPPNVSPRPIYTAGYVLSQLPSLITNSRLSGTPIDPGALVEADGQLANNLSGDRSSRRNLGSPLAPRIPAVVTVEFWVTRNRTRPGAPEVLKRFAQGIQIPTAQGRTVENTIAFSPGASI